MRPPPLPPNNNRKGVAAPYVAPTQGRLGRCLRVRRRIHGHRSRRPDPQADRRQPERIPVTGVAVVHQLHGGDGCGHARHRSGGQPDRPQTHAVARPADHHRRRGPGRHVRQRAGNRWLAGTLGTGQRVVHRHRAGHHRQLGTRIGGPGDHPLRGGAWPWHRGRPASRRRPRLDLLARTVLRGVGADGLRAHCHHLPAAVHPACRTRHHAGRPVPRAASPRPARRRNHRAAVQLRLLHAAWRSHHSRST